MNSGRWFWLVDGYVRNGWKGVREIDGQMDGLMDVWID